MKLRKSKLKLGILIMIISVMMTVPALAAFPVYGSEKWFQTDLPNTYGNAYFQIRNKQSNVAYGYVRPTAIEKGCNGFNAWFCNSSYSRCTNVTYCSGTGTNYTVTYTSNYNTGASVVMGVEDYDNTVLGYHTISGYVNYN